MSVSNLHDPNAINAPLLEYEGRSSMNVSCGERLVTSLKTYTLPAIGLCALTALAYVSILPFNAPAKEFAHNVKFLEGLYVSCNTIGNGSLMAWSSTILAFEAADFFTSNEFKESKYGKRIMIITYLVWLLILSEASRIPNIEIAGKYSSNIAWPIIVAIGQAGLPILSLHRMFKRIKGMCIKSEENPDLASLQKAKEHILGLSQSEIDILIDYYANDKNRFKSELINLDQKRQEGVSCPQIRNGIYYSLQTVGFATVIGQYIFKGKLSYNFAGEILYNERAFQIIFASICVAATAYINAEVTFKNIDKSYQMVFGNSKKTVSNIHYPISTGALKTVAFTIGALGFAAMAQASENQFGLNNPFGIYIGVSVISNTSILAANAMLDLADWLVRPIIRHFGSSIARKKIELEDCITGAIASS